MRTSHIKLIEGVETEVSKKEEVLRGRGPRNPQSELQPESHVMLRERIIGGYDLDPTGTLDEMVISLNLYCDFKDFDQNTKGLTGRCCT